MLMYTVGSILHAMLISHNSILPFFGKYMSYIDTTYLFSSPQSFLHIL
uniref:Uncharacterized protein n=1 Tax=Arundo donax TaxID=35708 RepID=A0A0A8Z7N3_ARUDO